jgi:hypothetical protein
MNNFRTFPEGTAKSAEEPLSGNELFSAISEPASEGAAMQGAQELMTTNKPPVPTTPQQDNMHGYHDPEGNTTVPTTFDSAGPFIDGLACVEINGKWGFVDTQGDLVIAAVYDDARSFSEGLACVEINGKWGFVDTRGNMALAVIYGEPCSFREGLAFVELDGHWEYINTEGKVPVAPGVYDAVGLFKQGLAAVKRKKRWRFTSDRWGFVDTKGKVVIPLIYDSVLGFSEGLAAVQLHNKWGFVDTKGDMVLAAIYDSAYSFSDGRALVELAGKGGFIDHKGIFEPITASPRDPYYLDERLS